MRAITKASLIAAALTLFTVLLIVVAVRGSLQESCEVCVTFLGHTACREAVGATRDEAARTALDNDLTIESIDLAGERITEFYAELPINITVEGDYHKIGSFVSGVANLSRIVTLHDFNVSPIAGSQNLKMNILAKTYRYLDDEDE